MRQPKLILPIDGVPLIARVIAALRDGGADRVVVVAAPVDQPGAPALIEVARSQGAEVVVAPSPTADMRASIELGIEHLANGPEPTGVLLAPGDSPGLKAFLVARVIRRSAERPNLIVVPCHDGRRGHPLFLPWSLARVIPRLPFGVGVNAMLATDPGAIIEIHADDPGFLADLDTPEEYRVWSDG